MHEPTPSAYVRPASIQGQHFQVVIVGAGINGIGVFRDLCLQGVQCLLIDKGDVGSGASSAPSRMIHGGLRYLENAEFSLVKESAQERNNLLLTAPHLVQPLHTVIPLSSRLGGLFGSALRFFGANPPARSRGVLAVALGLKLYELMGRKDRSLPGHCVASISQADKTLLSDDVRWTAHFYDAWINHPERLMHELIADGHRAHNRSVVSNHCELLAFSENRLTLRDTVLDTEVGVTADLVVNATGAWLEQLSGLFGAPKGRLVGTKGSHLVLDHPALLTALKGRMVYFEANDGRVCIVYPFMGRVLAGSTDIPVVNPDKVQTDVSEIEYLLKVLHEVFPRLNFSKDQIVYTFVGVRPLATIQSGNGVSGKPGKISRDHHVIVDSPQAPRTLPVVNLVGGKWTTFRALAEEATDAVLKLIRKQRSVSTVGLPIPSVDLGFDGADIQSLRRLCRLTGVVRLSDLVLHRSLAAFLGHLDHVTLDTMAQAASEELGWSIDRRHLEVSRCRSILVNKHNMRQLAEAHEKGCV
ncbi:MAG: glycerol-3-phosphate dehydrogenase/oxidase [Burkholderiaceae bacterium]|nr:glycerol-3-phosphate dehydrogenase/oxidase [Burkholderiaceae bacterium]